MNEFKLPIKYNWELAHKPITEICTEQPYKTGILDDFPWIVTPTMVSTCNKVIDTPAFPTALPINLQGYKVVGSLTLPATTPPYIEYIGSVEINSLSFPTLIPWKTDGDILAYDDNYGEFLSSAFANGAYVTDDTNDETIQANRVSIMLSPYSPTGVDLFLIIEVSSATGDIYADSISFEYSFFTDEKAIVNFIQP